MANLYRNFRLLLYPRYEDDINHELAITCLGLSGVDYVRMLHDKDLKDDGTPAKPHYHYVVSFENAKSISAANKYFGSMGIESRFVQVIEDAKERKRSIRYLAHLDHPDKYQYDVELAEGPLKRVLVALSISREDENSRVLAVMELIGTFKGKEIKYGSLIRKCCEADLWGTLRHMGMWGVKLVEEHNYAYEYERYKNS